MFEELLFPAPYQAGSLKSSLKNLDSGWRLKGGGGPPSAKIQSGAAFLTLWLPLDRKSHFNCKIHALGAYTSCQARGSLIYENKVNEGL